MTTETERARRGTHSTTATETGTATGIGTVTPSEWLDGAVGGRLVGHVVYAIPVAAGYALVSGE